MIVLTATTGKIGGATLDALLHQTDVDAKDLAILTSSSDHPKFGPLRDAGVQVFQARYDEPKALVSALRRFKNATLFLVSTPEISLDFDDAPLGKGREGQHFNVIDAAVEAGIGHIFYTSLGFKDGSGAGVMRAHFRTEKRLQEVQDKVSSTAIRVGLYNESWPLYLGHYAVPDDSRKSIVIAGDGAIAWTAISDLGLAIAFLLVDKDNDWRGKSLFLSQKATHDLRSVCSIVDPSKKVEIVSPQAYVDHYKARGMDSRLLEWWVTTYPSLKQGHAAIDDPLLEQLLANRNKKPIPLAETIRTMMQK